MNARRWYAPTRVVRAWIVGSALVAGTSAALGQAAAAVDTASPIRKRTTYEDMQMFSQVLNQIRVNHPDSVDTHELLMAAVEGMVHEADPHSFVIRATRLTPEKEKAAREGKLYPVPIEFDFIGGSPVVRGVEPGTAAKRQDILIGDELIAIDGKPVNAQSDVELDVILSGDKGSMATLTFERRRVDGSLVRLDRQVKRERPGEATAVPAVFMLDAQTGYVRITSFMNDKVADDLHEALGTLEKQGAKRVVLDLRDNGGGSVKEAAHVAGEFLPTGSIVYTSEGRKKEVTDTGRVSRSFWKSERRYPIIVMINSGTASASELVAGALQDHDRALIVGRPSFGKSLLMAGFPLADGSEIVLVIGHVRTPCGRIIQRQYRSVTRREYYRLARADRDTLGLPNCKTDGGRTVYGGGGIYPDVVLPEPPEPPLWLARAREDDLTLNWLGGWVTANSGALSSLDSFASHPSLPTQALADFRGFAAKEGVAIPQDAAADSVLQRSLTRGVAMVKWGEPGYYRIAALLDPDVAAARSAFDKAQAILAVK